MKKIYALAAVACMALAANAQNGAPLYATGAGEFAGGEWAAGSPDQFTYADGVYTLEVANLTQFKISTATGEGAAEGEEWNVFNAGAYDCGENGYGDEPGVAVALVANPDAQNIVCPWKGDYTIKVAGDLSTITLTTTTEPQLGPVAIYLRGDMNAWGSEEAWQLTEISEGLYKFTCSDDQVIAVGEAFKIADADWNKYNVGGDGNTVNLNADTQVFNGGNPANILLEEEWDGVMYLDLRVPEDSWIWFSNDKEAMPEWEINDGVAGIEAENNAAVVYYNMQGVRVAEPENGLYIVVKGDKATKVLVK